MTEHHCEYWREHYPPDHALPDVSFKEPDLILRMPRRSRAARVRSVDWFDRTVDGRRHFLMGFLPMHIRGHADGWMLYVWVEVFSSEDVRKHIALTAGRRLPEERYVEARLANIIPCFPRSLRLPTQLRYVPREDIPTVCLSPGLHPLAQAHYDGLTLE